MTRRISIAGLISQGHQEINLSHTSAAVGLNSTLGEIEAMHVSVETAAVRYRADGTDPAPSTGVLLTAGHYIFESVGVPGNWAFIDNDTTAVVQIEGFNYAGAGSR